jgi:predicted metalloprotease
MGGGGGGMGLPVKMGGGVGGLIAIVIAVLLSSRGCGGAGDFLGVNGGLNGVDDATATSAAGETKCETETEQILCGVTNDVQAFWSQTIGSRYRVTKTVFFSGNTSTGCGQASAETGPFYCPIDEKIYLDLDFLGQLESQLGFHGDFAEGYVIAHEYGHHIQKLFGINDEVRQGQQAHPDQANALSIRLELQADCLAGVWGYSAKQRGLLEQEDPAEALQAAQSVGDDRIQQKTQGRIDPETWNHGSSADRMKWFTTGFESGDMTKCDTFNS